MVGFEPLFDTTERLVRGSLGEAPTGLSATDSDSKTKKFAVTMLRV